LSSSGAGAGWVAVGRVGRPHGLDGSFVVEDASEEPGRLAAGAEVYVERERTLVLASKRAGGRLVVLLARKPPRGALLELPLTELPPLPDDRFYVFQLVGLEVVEEGGRTLGRVRGVLPGVANDVLELDSGAGLPVVEECVREVDLHARRIWIARGFADES
jgi:16S rRNA processing protein RimM